MSQFIDAKTSPMAGPVRPAGVAVWLGHAAPVRSLRWLDGALAATAKLGTASGIVAGAASWLDLAAERAARYGMTCIGVPVDLELDYLGWAQIAGAAIRAVGASTILVDEASRPERAPEVCALAELLDATQLTGAVAVTADGAVIHARCVVGDQLHVVRVRPPLVIGVRIAGPPVEDVAQPAAAVDRATPPLGAVPVLRQLDLAALGLDPAVLAHRALPARGHTARKTIERVAEFVSVHAARPAW
jgi:hypothetical protein